MFGEAKRMDAEAIYRKMIQNGSFNSSDPRSIVKKDIDFHLNMAIDPRQWKLITKSPAALRSKLIAFDQILAFKHDLKQFRDEMTAKKQSYYIPVTMDELMARFVTNMARNDLKDKLKIEK